MRFEGGIWLYAGDEPSTSFVLLHMSRLLGSIMYVCIMYSQTLHNVGRHRLEGVSGLAAHS